MSENCNIIYYIYFIVLHILLSNAHFGNAVAFKIEKQIVCKLNLIGFEGLLYREAKW